MAGSTVQYIEVWSSNDNVRWVGIELCCAAVLCCRMTTMTTLRRMTQTTMTKQMQLLTQHSRC
jgi:hypothetical protein